MFYVYFELDFNLENINLLSLCLKIGLSSTSLFSKLKITLGEMFEGDSVVLNTSNLTQDKENVRLCQGTFAHFTFFPNFCLFFNIFFSNIFLFILPSVSQFYI